MSPRGRHGRHFTCGELAMEAISSSVSGDGSWRARRCHRDGGQEGDAWRRLPEVFLRAVRNHPVLDVAVVEGTRVGRRPGTGLGRTPGLRDHGPGPRTLRANVSPAGQLGGPSLAVRRGLPRRELRAPGHHAKLRVGVVAWRTKEAIRGTWCSRLACGIATSSSSPAGSSSLCAWATACPRRRSG